MIGVVLGLCTAGCGREPLERFHLSEVPIVGRHLRAGQAWWELNVAFSQETRELAIITGIPLHSPVARETVA